MSGLGRADPGGVDLESVSQRWGEVRNLGGGGRGAVTAGNLSHQEREGSPCEAEAESRLQEDGRSGAARRTDVRPARPGARGAQAFGASSAIGTRFTTLALTAEQAPRGSPGKLQ